MNASKLAHRSTLVSLALGSALFAGAALASATAADGDLAVQSTTVRYADVNLATVAGATTLYRRIQGAARFVCGESGRSLAEQHAWKECYQNAVEQAVAKVNNPTLSAVHLDHEPPATAMLGR
jgi:UrcA family protein